MVLGLRAVMDAFGEVADHAGAERAVAAEAQLAIEHETDLLEIMPMARRIEIGGGAADRQLEIIDAAFLALGEIAEVEGSAAIFEPATPFERITVYDLHRFLLVFFHFPSCPDLFRASTSPNDEIVDGRDKPGHDDEN